MRASAARVRASLLATQSPRRKTSWPRSSSETTDCRTQTSVSAPATMSCVPWIPARAGADQADADQADADQADADTAGVARGLTHVWRKTNLV